MTACVIAEDAEGKIQSEIRVFGGFKRDRRALAEWALQWQPEIVVMESTGIYWKSPYAALEQAGIVPLVVNARHVKQVPGRKTDVADCQWLAILARCGLLRGSFLPPRELRELRVVARQRQKLTGTLAAEKNRMVAHRRPYPAAGGQSCQTNAIPDNEGGCGDLFVAPGP